MKEGDVACQQNGCVVGCMWRAKRAVLTASNVHKVEMG